MIRATVRDTTKVLSGCNTMKVLYMCNTSNVDLPTTLVPCKAYSGAAIDNVGIGFPGSMGLDGLLLQLGFSGVQHLSALCVPGVNLV